MSYEIMATATTQALVIYLLDISASMGSALGDQRRIDVVTDALTAALRQMVFRSTKGGRLSPRYRIAMFAYSDTVYDLLEGSQTVEQVAHRGVPDLSPMRTTETAKAFAEAENLLLRELPDLYASPAPLVCHMTDGEYTGADPEPVDDPVAWPGILPETRLANEYARKLQDMSSPLPESYRMMMLESNYRLGPGALMLLPGMSPDLVAMGFQMSAATPVR